MINGFTICVDSWIWCGRADLGSSEYFIMAGQER
jgi:hypothetical protein